MNPCIIPPADAPKKRRAPRRSSVLFCTLELGREFWLPNRKSYLFKTNFFSAFDANDRWVFINPFRSVFVTPLTPAAPESELERHFGLDSERLVTKVAEVIAKQSPFVALMDRAPFPVNQGQTHFVGDDCPGGHADKPVNNDNNITGPTS